MRSSVSLNRASVSLLCSISAAICSSCLSTIFVRLKSAFVRFRIWSAIWFCCSFNSAISVLKFACCSMMKAILRSTSSLFILILVNFFDLCEKLGDLERLAFDLRQRDGRNEVFRPQQHSKLPHVQFWNKHAVKSSEYVAKIS